MAYIYIYNMQSSTKNTTKIGPHNGIEFADFGVYKAWQFSNYDVRRDPFFEM